MRQVKRAQILLAADAQASDERIAADVGVGTSTVYRTKQHFVEDGLARALSETPRRGAPRKLSASDEARLVAVACSAPPAGRARWTLELLAGELVRLTTTGDRPFTAPPGRTAVVQSGALSMREYDLIADWYRTDRGRTVGVAESLAVAATLPAGSCILDIGCGNGVPIAEALVNAGHRVVGLDTSAGMLQRFRVNLPGTPVVHGDVRHSPFSEGSFDAAVSWGMMFHLPYADQAAAFASVSRVLKPGASFLFTAAEIDGADDAGITGTMNGVTFHYYAVPSYRRLVAEHGFVLVDVHDDPGVSTYYLTRRSW